VDFAIPRTNETPPATATRKLGRSRSSRSGP
jgi:hypothetical protein